MCISNKNIKIIIFQVLVLFLTNCSHYYYTPNSQIVPLFQKKSEARLSAGIYGSKESEGFVVNTALAITDHVGVIGNFMHGDTEDDVNWGRGDFGEIGIGYFESPSINTVFEFYGGYGYGIVENQYDIGIGSKLDYSRYFIQPSFGITTKVFDIAVSGRLCLLSYHKIKYDSEFIDDFQFENIEYIINHKNFILFEPGITLRLGSEKFKIQAQLVKSITETNIELKQEEVNFNIGFLISF